MVLYGLSHSPNTPKRIKSTFATRSAQRRKRGIFPAPPRGQTTPVDGLDFVLNRHAVTVPARYIRCIKARHRARFDDDVLENFVHRVTDVNVTVRIRRAVVQNEFRTVLLGSDLTNFVIAFC